jgi:transcriptional regulator with XRE-family HTH domain
MADSHAEPPHVRTDLPDHAAQHLLLERFPGVLRRLIEERHLTYRQLAYKTQLSPGYLNHLSKGTRPVPADPVIRTIATALRVEPNLLLEYRLRQVVCLLEGSIQLIDALYSILLLHAPVSDEMKAILEKPDGDGHDGPHPPLQPRARR